MGAMGMAAGVMARSRPEAATAPRGGGARRARPTAAAAATNTAVGAAPAWHARYRAAPGEGQYVLPVFRGNYAPQLNEIDSPGALEVLEGQVPADFPAGMYVRNGPNPAKVPEPVRVNFGPISVNSASHWFEGDGMLHGVTFAEGDGGGMVATYRNRFVQTKGLQAEKAGAPPTAPLIDADAGGMLLSVVRNTFLGGTGEVSKNTANTSVVAHAGRLLALNEGGLPHAVRPDLSTVGEDDLNGSLDFSFTAHPKADPKTGELVFFGTDFVGGGKPYARVGVIGSDGALKTRMDVVSGLDLPSLMHDCAATRSHTVLIDVPINSRPERMANGESPIQFEKGRALRFGVVPRHGPATDIRWFEDRPGMIFHVANAWEEDDGQTVMIRAMRADEATITPPSDSEENYLAWVRERFATGISNVCKLFEYKIDLARGTLESRELPSPEGVLMEFPTINPQAAMSDNGFTYAAVLDADTSATTGAPVYGGLAKFDHRAGGFATHRHGEGRFGGEPQFVAREGATTEDDGFVVTFVHDEAQERSEVVIIDAQRFDEGPVCRLAVPQRVPYGLHGQFVPAG